jgi:hypothetical protein
MFTLTDWRLGWAGRSLRESKADLAMAKKMRPPVGKELAISAMRKAQMAMYYIFGDPYIIGPRVHQITLKDKPVRDPLLKLFVSCEWIISDRISKMALLSKDELIQEARFLVDLTSDVLSSLKVKLKT